MAFVHVAQIVALACIKQMTSGTIRLLPKAGKAVIESSLLTTEQELQYIPIVLGCRPALEPGRKQMSGEMCGAIVILLDLMQSF